MYFQSHGAQFEFPEHGQTVFIFVYPVFEELSRATAQKAHGISRDEGRGNMRSTLNIGNSLNAAEDRTVSLTKKEGKIAPRNGKKSYGGKRNGLHQIELSNVCLLQNNSLVLFSSGEDNNGKIDLGFIDDDENGFVEGTLIDKDEDGVWEIFVIDSDENGKNDQAYLDTDGDKKPDVLAHDYNEDGEWDKFEELS